MTDVENDVDIDSLVKTKSSSDNVKTEVDVEENVWYEAKIARIVPYTKKDKFKTKNLRWIFDLQGDEFKTEYNGNPCQQSIMTVTSTFMAPGTRLCKLYCDITGKSEEDIENDKVSIKALIGKPCYIMVEHNPKDGGGHWVNLKAVKSANSKSIKKQAKQVPNAENITDPADIKFDDEKPKTAESKSEFTAEEEELFKDLIS